MKPRLLAALIASCVAPAAYAYDCPRPSQQLSQDQTTDVHTSVSALGGLGMAVFDTKSATVTQDLFSKYPNADKLAVANTMLSMFCQVILASTTMSDADKLDQLYRLEDRVTGVSKVSVPLNRAIAPACPTDPGAVLAPIRALFRAWGQLDADLYLAQWGPDAIARSKYYVYRVADYAKRRRADFGGYRSVTVVSTDPHIDFVDATKAKISNTYTMHFISADGRVVDERGIRESYVLECLARDRSWLIRENNDYQ